MHEMALVRNVVDVVLDEAEAAHAAEVRAVHLVIGEGRDVVEEYFESLFQFLARGTVAERAEVIIRRVPYRVQCNRCGAVFHVNVIDRATWACPACEAYQDYTLVSGMEFSISKIEAVERERTSA
ncbi:hydrogenase maturation nickel metallochaperone HypA [Eggerthella guodeyinii]|uniref:Hydrogenase maturation factor HypA n=1 Tax=Eggerthella guodeyinii TaxID=2690837 RepID=A0A6L7ISB4_9ACTN|nr:hydrogenase maturation nickel metallochaperone HypA [Eggerthella guodeyinii]QOS68591.1 hydrogenase maturation nickel metallochaperone HypA [Eggerthella guodeyinii]